MLLLPGASLKLGAETKIFPDTKVMILAGEYCCFCKLVDFGRGVITTKPEFFKW